MPTVCILYGFGEGPRVSGRFRRVLAAKGYEVIGDATRADVIITHSGGHLLLPEKIRARKILHIAPYYWPGRSWFASLGRKLHDDLTTHYHARDRRFWVRKTLWNFTYIFKLPTFYRMLTRHLSKQPWPYGERTIVVRPRYDTFCVPDPKLLPFKEPPTFVSLPGHHDDCWRDPAPYIALLK